VDVSVYFDDELYFLAAGRLPATVLTAVGVVMAALIARELGWTAPCSGVDGRSVPPQTSVKRA
jgi:hypothetical protein